MKTFLVSVSAVLLLVGGCSNGPGAERTTAAAVAADRIAVSVARVERRDLVDEFQTTGSIAPFEKVTVYSRTTGYLKSLRVDIGDQVRKGDLLAEVEAPEMLTALEEKEAAVLEAEAALEQVKAEVVRGRAELRFAEVSYQRLERVHDREPDMIPDQEVDQAQAELDVTRAKLRSAETKVKVAEAAITAARAEVKTTETLLSYARLTAPLAGVISARFVDPGALIQEASSSRTQAAPVVTIERLDRLRVIIDVPEPSVPAVQPGSRAEIHVPAFPDEPFAARVTRIGTVLDPASRTMRAEIELPNPKARLRPGMTAKVSIELRRAPNAMAIPSTAVRSDGGPPSVFVVHGDSVRETRISTGLELSDWVEVAEGLRDGDQVVIAAAGVLRDGGPVRIQP